MDLALKAYPEARAWLKRARFYSQALEFEWLLPGIESGDLQWFVAHLGGARLVDLVQFAQAALRFVGRDLFGLRQGKR